MQFLRGFVNRLVTAFLLVLMASAAASAANVVVEGNHRVDAETVRSYFTGIDQATTTRR